MRGGRQGCVLWTHEGKRYSTSTASLMCRQHRPRRRRGGEGDPGPGGNARLRHPVHGHRGRGPGWGPASAADPGDIDVFFFTNAAPRRTKMRSRSRGRSPAATRSWRVIVVSRWHRRAIAATGDPRRWTHRQCRRDSRSSTPITARARLGRCGPGRWPPEEVITLEGPHHRRLILETVTAPTASSSRPTATSRASAPSATSTAS